MVESLVYGSDNQFCLYPYQTAAKKVIPDGITTLLDEIIHKKLTLQRDKVIIFAKMFKKIKQLYNEYKPYVRVDLIMYGVLILSIFLYFIISTFL